MGLPLEDCPKTNRPYIAFTTTTSSTTTPQPTLEYYQLPASGSICPVDPCICGSLFVPRGLKYGNSGSTLTIGSNTYSLAHPLDGFVDKEQSLITTSTKLLSDTVLQTDNVTINLGISVNLVGVIRVIVKIRETQKIIGQVITGSFNESVPVSSFKVNLIDTFNLTNLTLQIEISSLCKNSKEVCCDRLPSSFTLTNTITSITCSTTTTTTTTTLPPFCSQFNLPDSFYITVIGYGALNGQQQISLVTRSGQTWSTSGSFPCGASYVLSMTCDSSNSRFTYFGSINCCEEATKTIISPTSSPLIYPDVKTPKIIEYTDCYCDKCTTTTTTTTTTTDFPTTPPPPPPVPCKETESLTINGYAFYRTQKVNVDIPGVGPLMAKCAGGHVCNRTDFLPQLITATKTIDAQPISLNNVNLTDKNVSANFSFNITDASILKNGASFSLKCLSSNGCHTGVTWVVLTYEKDGKTQTLFNSCVLPNEIDPLDFECENCCDWDGEGVIKFATECDNLQENVKLLKVNNYLWELDTTLSCGDKINALVRCKPEVDYIDLDSCKNKWELVSFSFPCATNARMTGNLLEPCDCNKAPIFEFTADNFNGCKCCGFDADFLVLKYLFTDGRDLDTRTSISVGPESGTVVGWCRDDAYNGTGGLWYEWGGDNTGTGYESVLIYLNNIRAAYPSTNIVGKAASMWYDQRISGNITLNLLAYKGGTMSKTGYTWTNIGGELTASISIDKNIALNTGDCNGEETASFFTYTTNNNLVWSALP